MSDSKTTYTGAQLRMTFETAASTLEKQPNSSPRLPEHHKECHHSLAMALQWLTGLTVARPVTKAEVELSIAKVKAMYQQRIETVRIEAEARAKEVQLVLEAMKAHL